MRARSVWIAGASVLLFASLGAAQTVYTWRDDKGVVHFSDENPEGVKNVEKLTLEAPAPLVSDPGEGEPGSESTIVVTPGPGGGPGPGAQAPGAPGADAPSGPPEVVFLGADLAPTGATQRSVRGRLRNVGGAIAGRVAVRIVITDGDTGNLCRTDEIRAQPTDLGPGESGAFEGQLDTPCFYGNPKVSYYPEWD